MWTLNTWNPRPAPPPSFSAPSLNLATARSRTEVRLRADMHVIATNYAHFFVYA